MNKKSQLTESMFVYVKKENLQYLRAVAKKNGTSKSAVVNALLAGHRSKRYLTTAALKKLG